MVMMIQKNMAESKYILRNSFFFGFNVLKFVFCKNIEISYKNFPRNFGQNLQ